MQSAATLSRAGGGAAFQEETQADKDDQRRHGGDIEEGDLTAQFVFLSAEFLLLLADEAGVNHTLFL